jgi:hypothetical protein
MPRRGASSTTSTMASVRGKGSSTSYLSTNSLPAQQLQELTCSRSAPSCCCSDERLQDAIVTSVIHRLHHPLYTSKVRPQTPSSSSSNPSSSPSWPLNGNGSSTPTKSKKLPVALFTAGGMGAGKGHVLRSFLEQGIIELDETFVW